MIKVVPLEIRDELADFIIYIAQKYDISFYDVINTAIRGYYADECNERHREQNYYE